MYIGLLSAAWGGFSTSRLVDIVVGVQVFGCPADRVVLLNRGLLRKFQNLVARAMHEHILYGLDDREHTLEEVGHPMGLTRERIRQIEKRAEDKLRTLLHEEDCRSATASGDVEPASSRPSERGFSEDARQAPAASLLAISQDTRTFIQNGSG